MVTQLQPDVRAYLHGAEVIKRYINSIFMEAEKESVPHGNWQKAAK